MIFYFSATGNCKYVAARIAKATGDAACSIQDFEGSVCALTVGEQLGIVTPTYSWELPKIVSDFLHDIQFAGTAGHYIYTVSTYGTTPGASGAQARRILKSKGVPVTAMYSVRMPDTWTPMFDLSDKEKVAAINAAAEKEIDKIIDGVKTGITGNHMDRSMPYAVRLVSDKLYDGMRKTSHFTLEGSCIGCGLCAKKCPVKAIEMRDKRPVWTADRCIMCLGCLHRCPEFAIQYGKNTKKHGQYRNPNLKGMPCREGLCQNTENKEKPVL